MSGVVNCYDNAAMESFFHSLKTEWTDHNKYKTRDAAQGSIFEYIELLYNRQRCHSYSDTMSPLIFEAMAKVAELKCPENRGNISVKIQEYQSFFN